MNHNRPPTAPIQDPVELEVLTVYELAAHPLTLEMELALMGGMAIAATVQSAVEDI